MLNRILLSIVISALPLFLLGQKPVWTFSSERENNYPANLFYTGYMEGNVRAGETVEQAKNRALKDAQGMLSGKIRITIKTEATSSTNSVSSRQNERIDTEYRDKVQTATDVEIVGVHSEAPYYDASTGIVYAFAYVSRKELSNYYRSDINLILSQVEGALQTAKELESAGEKSKARQQCEAAKPLLAKVRASQDMLATVSPGISSEDLQQPRTEAINSYLAQMQAQLAQAVFVYVVSNEFLFNTKVNIVANQLKAELAKSGCSFVDDARKADFKLSINVTTRHANDNGNFVFCYADTQVELYDIRKQKVVYSDEIAQKGGDISQEKAARRAMADVVKTIFGKLKPWIEN